MRELRKVCTHPEWLYETTVDKNGMCLGHCRVCGAERLEIGSWEHAFPRGRIRPNRRRDSGPIGEELGTSLQRRQS